MIFLEGLYCNIYFIKPINLYTIIILIIIGCLKIKKDINCKKCKYSWKTKSKLLKASCPNCGDKVKVPKGEDK